MADLSLIYSQTAAAYQRPEDIDFPVSKIRLFVDVLWQAITGKTLTEDQKTTLKQLIDLLNLLDEHKHEAQKELIAAMLPSISPLLEKMPTLGLTGTHVFTHLVPIYQLYLPTIEQMVKDAHPFTLEETLLYYELTIFDHLFLVHIFEQEHDLNMIELLLTIKAIILINALVYDFGQHVKGRSISFFTFLMRGGMGAEKLEPFLLETVDHIVDEVKLTVQNPACLETLEFLQIKLLETTKTPSTQGQKEEEALTGALAPQTPPETTTAVFQQATPLVQEPPTAPTETLAVPVSPTPVLAPTEVLPTETVIPEEKPEDQALPVVPDATVVSPIVASGLEQPITPPVSTP